jgi:hypothetical protein
MMTPETGDEIFLIIEDAPFVGKTKKTLEMLLEIACGKEHIRANLWEFGGPHTAANFRAMVMRQTTSILRSDRDTALYNNIIEGILQLYDYVHSNAVQDKTGDNMFKSEMRDIKQEHASITDTRSISQFGGTPVNTNEGFSITRTVGQIANKFAGR